MHKLFHTFSRDRMGLILAFGSKNPGDTLAWELADILKKEGYKIKKALGPEELENIKEKYIILDVVKGLKKTREIQLEELKKRKAYTIHDLDLGFILKLKNELGELKPKIIGIPLEGNKKKIKEEIIKTLKIINFQK